MPKSSPERTRVIVVCMLDSIHTARWLAQLAGRDIDFMLFPSTPHRKIHYKIRDLSLSQTQASYRFLTLVNLLTIPVWLLDKVFDNGLRGFILRQKIRSFRPDYVHAMELQNAGYVSLKALSRGISPRPKLISTNWGSDIYWFQRFTKHKIRLRELLRISDFYSAECNRDLNLALELGFCGKFMPLVPNSGGFPQETLDIRIPPASERRAIVLKGYDGWVGRAKIALASLRQLEKELEGIQINVIGATLSVRRLSKRLKRRTSLDIITFAKHRLTHEEVLEIMRNSLIYLGVSESDGISTSMLEAMACGAIPVQTSSSCCDEWFSDSGVSIDRIDVESVAKAVRKGLRMSRNPDFAATNRKTIKEKASYQAISPLVKGFYSRKDLR